ncbi:MAG: hypothetical protein KAV99_01965 [Candidatus Latescibacteria bacterium]|nr:hypothetical protein [Candidatus Latescibacterota bacterium]
MYDAFNIRRQTAGGDHRWSKWDCEGLKVGVHIEGTLNNPEDEDEYWQLEVAIPFADWPSHVFQRHRIYDYKPGLTAESRTSLQSR